MTEAKKDEWDWVQGKPGTFIGEAPNPFLAPTVRWDANLYVALARVGYEHPSPSGHPFSVAFFPLYPLVVRGVTTVVGDTFWAAFLVSNVAAFLAALVMFSFASVPGIREDGVRAALIMLASPGAHFLSYPYPEGLFVLFVALAFLAIALDRPLHAILPGALATATRSAGVVVSVALLLRAWEHRRHIQPMTRWIFAAFASLAGVVAFSVFCHFRFDDALAFAHIQQFYGRRMSLLGPLSALVHFTVDPDYFLITFAAIGLSIAMMRCTPIWMSLGSWFLLLLPMSTGTLKAMIRYQGANVPLLAGAGRIWRGRAFVGVILTCLVTMAFEAFLFGKGIGHY